MKTLVLLAGVALAMAACSRNDAPAAVQALDPWCRPAPEGAYTAACYLTLTANTDDQFVTVATPRAGRTEIHTMSMDGGVMRMRPLPEGVELPRNKAVALKPGSEHLMLIGPTSAFVEGESVPLTLTFAKAPPLTVQAPVRRTAAPAGHPAS